MSSVRIRENVSLRGYEEWLWWIRSVGIVLAQELLLVMRQPVADVHQSRLMSAGSGEYLPSTPVSRTDSLQRLRSGTRQPRRGGERNLPGVTSYPDGLLYFQAERLAVS